MLRGMASASKRSAYPSVQLGTDDLQPGPWIYARQVASVHADVADGDLVEVADASGRFIGHALYNGNSDIRLRMLSRGRKNDLDRPAEFLFARLASADKLRRKLLRIEEVSDAYRVAHAEGDDLPGLVVDRLGPVLVCEYHSLGFWKLRDEIERALARIYPGLAVHHRVPRGVLRTENFPRDVSNEDLAEGALDVGEVEIEEHGLVFPVRPAGGHKTGWFCDQRENRVRVARLARGRDVLDLCCNAGGFALQAARAGAKRVRAVDLDEVVLGRAEQAARRNRLDVEFVHADAYPYLRHVLASDPRERPELVVVDPHKLIPSKKEFEIGLRRYSDLNALALECVRPGGLVASFSCSGSLPLAQFVGMLFQAARRAERRPRLLELLGAGPDHPQRPEFSRSSYLKGALLAVD